MSVGIDIGSKTIKAIELKMEEGKSVLKGAGIVGVKNLNIEKITDDSQYSELAAIIKKLFSDAKISSKEVVVSLPESAVFTRSLRFPLLTDQEIASAVKWQAEDIIPIPLKDAIFQHVVLERRENTQPPEVSVLVVAAPRILVEKYVKLLGMAGLTAVGVETELLALSRSLSVPNKTILIIDFGAKATNMAIVKNEKLVFSRTIPTAGDAITRSISQNLSIDPAQAEEYKKTYGLNPMQLEGKVMNSILPVFKIVVEEIKKAEHFYQTDEKGEMPSITVLSGGSAGLPEVAGAITKLIGTEVVIANPFAKISISNESAQSLKPFAPLYSVAVGLALKEE
jgi:type IV pilus assembly protein PilM